MKKHKKIIGVVLFTVLLVGVGFTYFIWNVKAVNTVPSCHDPNTKENEFALERYFGIYSTVSVVNNVHVITLKCSHGTFKITKIEDPKKNVKNSITTKNGYVYIDGKEAVLGGKNESTVSIKVAGSAGTEDDILKFSFELTDGGATNCDSYKTYNEKKGKNQTTATYKFDPMEIELPNLTAGGEPLVDNTNYNRICKAIREGVNYNNKIGSTFMRMYDSSSAAKEHYKAIVDECFPPNNKVTAVSDEGDIKTLIELALESWNSIKSDTFADNEVESSWSLNFNNIKSKVPSNHKFYTDAKGTNFYKLTSSGGKGASVSKKPSENAVFTQKCNYKAKSSNDFSNLDLYKKGSDGRYLTDADGKKVYNIDANVDYYYAKSVETEKASYHYNYTHGVTDSKTVNVCKRTCEEVVEVKYGPPIASKAGLCFEYQIQVTSRVKCSSDVIAPKPQKPKPCTDVTPWCNNGVPGHLHQGGSNLEFDACISSCDGGKYTDKCSDKCYKKVYGNTSGLKDTSLLEFEADVEKVSFPGCSGNYYWTGSGMGIAWSNGGTYAAYYCNKEGARTRREHGTYWMVNGFKRRNFGGGNYCHDVCYFSTSCSRKSYFSQSDIMKDYIKNVRAYKQAIEKCKAAATCTEKTAKFKISVTYKDKDGDKTVHFPVINQEEITEVKKEIGDINGSNNKLVSSEDTNACNSKPDVSKDTNVLLNYGGCYQSCGTSKQYHSRWSFPGTWINKKTGKIVYYNPSNADSWKKQENKFCIPLNAKNVNTKWWNYYYNHVNSTASTPTSVTSDEFKDVCLKNSKSNSNNTNVTNTTQPSVSTWNINGSTTKFGYFGWNFDFKCFYALNSNPANVSTSSSSTNKEIKEKCVNDTPETDYKIRTIDLTNLFPSTDGSQLPSSAAVGRQPGYNWTKYANNAKNPAYISTPLAYINDVQTLGYNVYNGKDNLDYEFELTPAVMKKMRDQNKVYGEFSGTSKQVATGIIAYESKLWRTGVLAGSATKASADPSVIGCNNIANYEANTCKGN